MVAATGLGFTSCSDDDLDSTSIINPSMPQQNEFDKWLKANFIDGYNVEFKYRYDHNETDLNYYNVPARFEEAVKLAHIVKYTCLEAYDEIAGPDFTRAYFPKMLYAVGDFEYRNNGTIILGTAEGGKKIFLAGTNYLEQYMGNRDDLNEFYLKTIHHEFGHILNQNKENPKEFKQITPKYIKDSWSNQENSKPSVYLPNGFITAYARSAHEEDFVEMVSTYICNSPSTWNQWLAEAGTEGAALITQKPVFILHALHHLPPPKPRATA